LKIVTVENADIVKFRIHLSHHIKVLKKWILLTFLKR